MSAANLEIARQCFSAYAEDDHDAIEQLIAPDFTFTSPLDNSIDRDTYFERCWPNHETIRSFDLLRLWSQGDEVMVTYEGHSTSGSTFRNTEVLTIRDGRIIAVEVYFGWNLPHPASPNGFVSA